MPINIVCPGCKKRFTVSDKFAGQKGPCPSCKTTIEIPRKEDEVVVHAPEEAGPKDSKGRATTAPILREEMKFSVNLAVGAAVAAILTIVVAVLLRGLDDGTKRIVGGFGALLLGPPLAAAGYAFLRNNELEPYRSTDLWIRAGICGAVYGSLWGAYAWVAWVWGITDSFEIWQILVIAVLAAVAGAFTAHASFELDFAIGLVHYGFYLIVTVLLAFAANIDVF
jgi:hypothetical protein